MFKKIISFMCILSIFIASGAFAYKRDVQTVSPTEQDETQNPKPQQDQDQSPTKKQPQNEDYGYSSGSGSTIVAGYVLMGVGGAAAITGTALVAANKYRTTSIIVSSAGGAITLAGGIMVLLGSRTGYAVAPVADPEHGTYGLSFAANF